MVARQSTTQDPLGGQAKAAEAVDTTGVKSVAEAGPLGIAKQSATTESDTIHEKYKQMYFFGGGNYELDINNNYCFSMIFWASQ